MSMLNRRRFFTTGGAVGLLAGLAPGAVPDTVTAPHGPQGCVSLDGLWRFRFDPEGNGEKGGWALPDTTASGWREVRVPHTWQVEAANVGYRGLAWYRRTFEAPPSWSERAVRVEFEAVFHSATVWVNGKEAGRHIGKGYQPVVIVSFSAQNM
jgi:beta-glucuronidase